MSNLPGKYDVARPYTAVFAILRREGKIAFVLRSNTAWMNGYYGLPSGKVEHSEPFLAATAREALEEVGVTIEQKDLHFAHVMHRNGHEGDMVWVDVFFEVEKWGGDVHNAEPHMHSELAWLDPSDLPENVIPPVREAIESIEAGKHYSEYGW